MLKHSTKASLHAIFHNSSMTQYSSYAQDRTTSNSFLQHSQTVCWLPDSSCSHGQYRLYMYLCTCQCQERAQCMRSLQVQSTHTVELLLLSSVQPLPATLKFWVPARLPNSPVAPRLILRLVDMRLQLACSAHQHQTPCCDYAMIITGLQLFCASKQ